MIIYIRYFFQHEALLNDFQTTLSGPDKDI